MSVAAKRSSGLLTDLPRQSIVSHGGKDRHGDVNMNDMVNENGEISLSVVLPDRRVDTMNVNYNTPMMDLLVQVASINRLKPGEHTISVVSEETGRAVEYQPSQTIGSLAVNRIFLLSKSMQRKQRETEIQRQRDASKFEQTIRVTINLPRGVKSLQRLNPHIPIMDIFRKISIEKGLDASRYEVRLTKQSQTPVDMSLSLNDYRTNEITILQCSEESAATEVPDFHTSMVDISRVGASSNTTAVNTGVRMAEPFEKVKKKKGLFSFLRKDKNKTFQDDRNVQDPQDMPKAWKKVDESRGKSVQALPQNGDVTMSRKPQAQVKPQPKVQPTIREEPENDDIIRNKAARAPSKKKYRAPAPPSRPLSTMGAISEESKTIMFASTPNLLSSAAKSSGKFAEKSRKHLTDSSHHSRNSSDSSGYHEPPVTPPDSASSPSTIDGSSLSRNTKRTSYGESTLRNQRPISAPVQRSQTLPPGASAASKKHIKKKAAPAPPPPLPSAGAIAKEVPPPSTLALHERIVESEDETTSLSSPTDDAPEMGILSLSATKSAPPPIFIPPPPPDSPPPLAVSESPHRETHKLSSESPASIQGERSKTPSYQDQAALHDRSESRCSRASVDTIDDVQQYFDLAIAAGEHQLRSEQGAVSPAANEEVARLSMEVEVLTDKLDKDPMTSSAEKSKDEPSQEDVNAAVAQIDMSIGDDEGSDGSLVPDGENFVIAASKMPSGGKSEDINGSVRSTRSDTGYAKPVEEISYGEVIRFDNPFRSVVPPVQLGGLTRRDSQMSDSTLPDSEHTDVRQSSSLQSSGLQSDEDESVTETGDGYETTGTEKVSQSETETSAVDVSDSPVTVPQEAPRSKRGLFMEARGQDVNDVIYNDLAKGSIRGVPGQESTDTEVKIRAASFASNSSAEKVSTAVGSSPRGSRPKSVFSIISTQAPATDSAAKKRPASVVIARDSTAASLPSQTEVKPSMTRDSTSMFSRSLPVYNRMSRSDSTTSDLLPAATPSPTTSEPRGLASVVAESVKTGEAGKSVRRVPEPSTNKPMFFKAARNSRIDVPTTPDKIENVIKLDASKYEVNKTAGEVVTKPKDSFSRSQPVVTTLPKKSPPPPTAAKPRRPGASLDRKESLKEQYNKLQENMAKWQNRLKDNESRVKELTASQQNLATAGISVAIKPLKVGASSLASTSAASKDAGSESAPLELHKSGKGREGDVTLRSAARRVINKPEPELDPVEFLMKSIRDRGGRASDSAPDRGIYVATGEREQVLEPVAQREVAPLIASGTNEIPPPPPLQVETRTTATRDVRPASQGRLSNGTSKADDPRFNTPALPRDSLLAEIANARGKPARNIPNDSSSSQSSSDELKEIQIRHKPQKTHRHKNSKRSVSDPFPPQGPNSRHHLQPTPTELDPREELMIAVRTSGGLSRLRQVNADEIKWSAHV